MLILLSFLIILSITSISTIPITNALSKKKKSGPNGSPGLACTADAYNSISPNWNITYHPYQPQQIHISLTDQSKTFKVQFATFSNPSASMLWYWPKLDIENFTTKAGKDWTFIDGGLAQRELYLHQFETDLLLPETVYVYKVGTVSPLNEAVWWSQEYEFHTASKSDEFSFLTIGDVGACNSVTIPHLKTYAKQHNYDFITVTGDQAYDMDDFNGTKGDQYMNHMEELFAQIPYLGVAGNHETMYNFSHYKNRFNTVPYRESNSDDPLMYSLNYKSLHFVSVSAEKYFSGSPNEIRTALRWLNTDLIKANLNRHETPWIIVATHRPIYCGFKNPDCTTKAQTVRYGIIDSITNETLDGLENVLLRHRVDIYLSGHVHNYERTYPVAQGGLVTRSYHNAPTFFQIVNGNAGQPDGIDVFDNNHFPKYSAARYSGYGFSSFKVSPTSLTVMHHAVHVNGTLGEIVDRVIVTKDKIPFRKKRDHCYL